MSLPSRDDLSRLDLATTQPSRGYLLCCIERTGSNLLSGLLSASGVAGRPMEYLNPVEQDKPWMREILGDSTMVDGFTKMLSAGATPNGLFGAKIHWSHFRFLGMTLAGEWSEAQRTAMYDLLHARLPELLSREEAFALLDARFPDLRAHAAAFALFRSHLPDLSMVWLRRRNMVARAISHFRARRTGEWFRAASTSETVPSGNSRDFDLAEIHTLWLLGCFQEQRWEQFFRIHAITPLSLAYEDLVTHQESSCRGVLEFLQLDAGDVSRFQPRSARQADQLSEEWEQRYREWSAKAGTSA